MTWSDNVKAWTWLILEKTTQSLGPRIAKEQNRSYRTVGPMYFTV